MTSLCNLRYYGAILRRAALAVPLACVITVASGPVRAESILPRPYHDLARELDRREGFEAWPARPEPGHLLQAAHRGEGIAVASHFAGQGTAILSRRAGGRFDTLTETRALSPLRLETGPPDQGIAIAQHRGFGSNAVFPIGPDGFAALSGRGEGALAILFDDDQRAVGLLVHSDYPDPLGNRPTPPGTVEVILMARDGRVLARPVEGLSPGITALGYQTESGLPGIAGLVVLNTDPGGIAVDDILFARAARLGGMQHSQPDLRQASWQSETGALLSRHAWQIAQNLPFQP